MPNPWIAPNGTIVHPNAPAGGGGPGKFRDAGPYGSDDVSGETVPHPYSPAGRLLALNDTQKRQLKKGAGAPSTPRWNDSDALNTTVKDNADAYVDQPVVGDGECYALIDTVLGESSAKSAPDFTKPITKHGDYKWGRPVNLREVKPGDILQFRNHTYTIHRVTITKQTYPDGSSTTETKTEDESHRRPHHSAIVSAVNSDGTLSIIEQHVKDPDTGKLSDVVRQNTLYVSSGVTKLPKEVTNDGMSQIEVEQTVTVRVSGTIWVYRPQPQ